LANSGNEHMKSKPMDSIKYLLQL